MNAVILLLLFLPILIASVVLHEYAHARVAAWQGDPTPEREGRLTLNPFPHLDFLGSFLVPVLLWLMPTRFLIGWAKPVRVNPSNYRHYRRGDILVSLAGVATNFLLAALFVPVLALLAPLAGGAEGMAVAAGPLAAEGGVPWEALLLAAAQLGLWLNLLLGVFNLLPLPPLDGSHVVYHLLPGGLGDAYRSLGRFGMPILFALVFLAPDLLRTLLWPVEALQDVAHRLAGLAPAPGT